MKTIGNAIGKVIGTAVGVLFFIALFSWFDGKDKK